MSVDKTYQMEDGYFSHYVIHDSSFYLLVALACPSPTHMAAWETTVMQMDAIEKCSVANFVNILVMINMHSSRSSFDGGRDPTVHSFP
jgi:hypothetical protein